MNGIKESSSLIGMSLLQHTFILDLIWICVSVETTPGVFYELSSDEDYAVRGRKRNVDQSVMTLGNNDNNDDNDDDEAAADQRDNDKETKCDDQCLRNENITNLLILSQFTASLNINGNLFSDNFPSEC